MSDTDLRSARRVAAGPSGLDWLGAPIGQHARKRAIFDPRKKSAFFTSFGKKSEKKTLLGVDNRLKSITFVVLLMLFDD